MQFINARRVLGSCLASLLLASAVSAGSTTEVLSNNRVVILHGLARSAGSMTVMEKALQDQGYKTCNVDYPSRDHTIAVLASEYVSPAIAKCFADQPSNKAIHFVTHSLGGIIVRQLAAIQAMPNMGRVVMLSPPNHGSEVVDKLSNLELFAALNGPAGQEIGTDAQSMPMRLGPATFELGIITGVHTINPFLSMMIPGKDDGKVSVPNAKLQGMKDFLVVRCSHPYIMKSSLAIEQTLHFLANGKFKHLPASHFDAHFPELQTPSACWN
jgi:triacylglycerol lipase